MKNKLAQQIALDVAVVIFGGMLVYAAYQFMTGEAGPFELFFRHLWHTVVLAVLVYGFLLLRLRSRVLKPLDLLYFHATEMSRGIFEKCTYPETHNEIDQITTTMNNMAKQLNVVKNASWQDYAEVIERHLSGLRGRETLSADVREELMQIRDCLRKMEIAFVGIKEAPISVIQTYGKVPGKSKEKFHHQMHGTV